MITREVTWGDAIVVEVFRSEGGLKVAVDAITAELGTVVGSRSTFAKLLKVSDPRELNDRDRWRAWLLLTALGQDPKQWDLGDVPMPAYVDPELLQQPRSSDGRRRHPDGRSMSAPVKDWNFMLLHNAVEQAMNTIGAAHGLPALTWMLCEDGMLIGWAGYSSGAGESFDEQLAVITPWIHALDLTIDPAGLDIKTHKYHRWCGEIDGWQIRITAKEPRATEVS